MLGVLDMDIDTCIRAYEDFSKDVFSDKVSAWYLRGKGRYHHKKLEDAVKRLVRTHAKSLLPDTTNLTNAELENLPMAFPTSQERQCKVFVCATDEAQSTPTFFRSYSLAGSGEAGNIPTSIVEAARATTAAPTFFEPATIGRLGARYVDGALNYNNPAKALQVEAISVWQDRKVGCLLSIGTGLQQLVDVLEGPAIIKTLRKKITDTENTHAELVKAYAGTKTYHRFDVNTGLEKLSHALREKPWLLVLDSWTPGVDETEYINLQANATVLISTTSRAVHGARLSMEMKDMDIEESTSLLLLRVSRWSSRVDDPSLRASVQDIVKDDLGCHPLAILQAGGIFENRNELDPEEFRAYFAALPNGQEDLLVTDHHEMDYRHARSVWKTFQMCFDDIKSIASRDDREGRLAATSLELIRFFALLGSGVPESFLIKAYEKLQASKSDSKQSFPLEAIRSPAPSTASELQVKVIGDACAIIDRFSLINISRSDEYRPRERIFRLHVVVRRCVLLDLRIEEQASQIYPSVWLRTVHTLSCALSFNPGIFDENLQRVAIPHLKACLEGRKLQSISHDYGEAASLDFIWLHFARIYLNHGNVRDAEVLQRDVIEYRQSKPTSEKLILEATHDLASTTRSLGKYQSARVAREKVIDRLLILRGAKGHSTNQQTPINDTLPQHIVEKMQKVDLAVGKDNFLLNAMENLAESWRDFGLHQDALKLQVLVVRTLEEHQNGSNVIDKDFDRLFAAQAKLAVIQNFTGDILSALQTRESIYATKQKQEPTQSLSLQRSKMELANSLHTAGFALRAKELRQETLDTMLNWKLYEEDPEHLDILDAKQQLASSLEVYERWEEAYDMKREVLAGKLKIFGPHHRETWKARSNVAYYYMRRGDFEKSMQEHRKVLCECEASGDTDESLKARDEIARRESSVLFRQKDELSADQLQSKVQSLHKARSKILEEWRSRHGEDFGGIGVAENLLLDVQFDFPTVFDRGEAHTLREKLLQEHEIRFGEDSEPTQFSAKFGSDETAVRKITKPLSPLKNDF
ncbi:hypothetical protein N0V83_010216 [Neocucurbitaria cava]|uniref:PNPLA domain-containing protein n=1 Tax=Neocucurbitaria cava TaxID=798079 RepID=A0A9W8Y1J6_9PLEO|nr:hypothetical protein N0V83_010216 [Neocucurbitaria cava]